jgi:hypothetical protein
MTLAKLEPFVGRWKVQATFPGAEPSRFGAYTTFEWELAGTFLLQRAGVPDVPEAPDVLAVIAPHGDGYTQHYFDSRGVVRIYAMTFEDGVWTLLREKEDFSPLDFRQRFVGEFSDDGDSITGRWETGDGDGWKLDFEMTYIRA